MRNKWLRIAYVSLITLLWCVCEFWIPAGLAAWLHASLRLQLRAVCRLTLQVCRHHDPQNPQISRSRLSLRAQIRLMFYVIVECPRQRQVQPDFLQQYQPEARVVREEVWLDGRHKKVGFVSSQNCPLDLDWTLPGPWRVSERSTLAWSMMWEDVPRGHSSKKSKKYQLSSTHRIGNNECII